MVAEKHPHPDRISTARLLLVGGSVATLAVLLCIALAEIGLRLMRESDRFYPYHPNSTTVMYPSEEITPGVRGPSYFTTNSYGTRGPELAGQPIRILTVGGSTTACTALDDSEAWPALLMQELNGKTPDDRFWVTNSGVDGHNTHHHLMHVKYLLPKLPDIDYVLVYAGLNDVGMWLYVTDWDPHYLDHAEGWASRVGEAFRVSNYTPADYPWYKRSEIWKRASILKARAKTLLLEGQQHRGKIEQDAHFKWMEREKQRRKRAEKKFVHRAKMESLPAALNSYERNVEKIIELVRATGAEPILMAQAMDHLILTEEERRHWWMGAVDGGKTYVKEEQMRELLEAHNDRMKRVADGTGVLYIDLPSLLKSYRELFIDGHHFNEYGARVAAQKIADFLWTTSLKDAVIRARGEQEDVRSGGSASWMGEPLGSYPSPGAVTSRVPQAAAAASIQPPQPIIPRPASRPSGRPAGTTFSRRTNTARAAIQGRFITPKANSRAISSQQHPRQ